MSGHCKDCHWWKHGKKPATWGSCLLTRSRATDEVYANTLAVAYAGTHDWRPIVTDAAPNGYLVTAPEFGCVQFKAKQ